GADVREANLLQYLANSAVVIVNAEPFLNHAFQVDPPPADHAILLPIRPSLDDLGKGGQLFRRQPRRLALGANIFEPVRALRVEAMNPVAQRLTIHAANARSVRSPHPIENRRQRQETPALIGVFRTGRKTPKLRSRIIRPDRNRRWHGANPPRAKESDHAQTGNPLSSQARRPLVSDARHGYGGGPPPTPDPRPVGGSPAAARPCGGTPALKISPPPTITLFMQLGDGTR